MTERAVMKPEGEHAPPILNVPAIVLAVIALLVGVHGALYLAGSDWQVFALYLFSFIPARLGGGEQVAMLGGSQVWSFVTYALLHGDWFHLGSNCVWLLIFSTPVSRRLGTGRYLLLLLVCAIAGAAAMLPLHWGQFLIVVGASAAVSGCMAAAVPIMFSRGFHRGAEVSDLTVLTPLELLTERRVIFFTLVFAGLQILTGTSQTMTGTAFLEERTIAWEAHLGGFLAGLAAFYMLDRKAHSAAG